MNEIQVFNNPDFGEVRTMEEDGAVLFCGSDVAKSLGYTNASKALKDHCKGVTKRYTPTNSGSQEMSFIPESDLYRLVFSSKLPTAEKFTDWVTSEVLPTIRKHGAYMTPETLQAAILNPDYLLQVVTALKEETDKRKALESKVEADAPMVLFAGSVCASKDSILIRDLAKILRQNGYQTGEKRLYQSLRDEGFLIRRQGSDYNMPTQRSMDMGLMEIKETTTVSADGRIRLHRTTKITGKGQQYFINKFLSERSNSK